MSEKSLIIIEAPNHIVSDKVRNICHKDFVEMRDSGIIVLPHGFKVVYAEPCCIEEDNNNSIGFIHESTVK